MVDRYTKIVLTVIACALVAIAGENAISAAHAQLDEPQKVQICSYTQCASLRPIVDDLYGKQVTSWGLAVVSQPK